VIKTCSQLIKTCSRLIKTCCRLWEGGVVLAGVKAKPCGWQCRVVSASWCVSRSWV
jgi:hypothetical protein